MTVSDCWQAAQCGGHWPARMMQSGLASRLSGAKITGVVPLPRIAACGQSRAHDAFLVEAL
jgi:hypothetical protein